MAPVITWTLVALVVAAVVMVLAALVGGRSGGLKEFLGDLRAGLRRKGRDAAEAAETATGAGRDALADESGSVEEIFTVGQPQETDYVNPEQIAHTLGRATQRAVRGVTHLGGR